MPKHLAALLAPFGTQPAAGPPRVGPGLAVLAALALLGLWLAAVLCGLVERDHGASVSPRESAVLCNRKAGIGQ